MRTRILLSFAIASLILLSFTAVSTTKNETDASKMGLKNLTTKDSHGGLVIEDPNQWD